MRPAGRSATLLLCLATAAGCGEPAPDDTVDASVVDASVVDVLAADVTVLDVPVLDVPAIDASIIDASAVDVPAVDVPPDAPPTAPVGVAPGDAVPGAVALSGGSVTVAVSPSQERVYRIDAMPDEHLGLRLDFSPGGASIVLAIERWDGRRAVALGETDGGSGVRFLAAYDPTGPRTFFARVRTTSAVTSARLTLTRTPFRDGVRCDSDCARLLQLPLPNDPARDGYAYATTTVFRYQFGRRDLVMFVRAAGQAMAAQGRAPFVPEDLSQWDGLTPGADRGALRHASHQRGKDVDLSLYGSDGLAPWRSYCTTRPVDGGRECRPGTLRDYGATASAALLAPFFASGRVTMCFLDRGSSRRPARRWQEPWARGSSPRRCRASTPTRPTCSTGPTTTTTCMSG
ncbi:MAG: hypothetical protein IPN17_31155 [Deltaproteobacteria bacterium]|nr:hypothetical protein [Deltaproteobacteria bacterium]